MQVEQSRDPIIGYTFSPTRLKKETEVHTEVHTPYLDLYSRSMTQTDFQVRKHLANLPRITNTTLEDIRYIRTLYLNTLLIPISNNQWDIAFVNR